MLGRLLEPTCPCGWGAASSDSNLHAGHSPASWDLPGDHTQRKGQRSTRQASGLFLLPFPCHCDPSLGVSCALWTLDCFPRASCLCLSAVLGGGVGRPACWERVRCFTESHPPSPPHPPVSEEPDPDSHCPGPSDLTPVSCPVPVSGQLLGQPRVPLPRGLPRLHGEGSSS